MEKQVVLVVDDNEIERMMLALPLQEEYEVLQASDGQQALEIIKQNKKCIKTVLLDLNMPVMGGMEVLKFIKSHKTMQHIPVLIVTADDDNEIERNCLNMGASDFIHKNPINPDLVKLRVRNNILLGNYRESLEDQVAIQTRLLRNQNVQLEKQAQELEEINAKIIDILATIVEYRNLESGQHVQRVKNFTKIIADRLSEKYPAYGLNSHRIDVIVAASAMHDIGKISISDNILLKPGKLTSDEFETMKTHTTLGYELVKHIKGIWNKEFQKDVEDIALYHHERFDGRGYPKGLKGNAIPISAQLVSIADVYDALVSVRCYKKSFDHQTACQMIINGECGVFNPDILDCFDLEKDKLHELSIQLHDNDELFSF